MNLEGVTERCHEWGDCSPHHRGFLARAAAGGNDAAPHRLSREWRGSQT